MYRTMNKTTINRPIRRSVVTSSNFRKLALHTSIKHNTSPFQNTFLFPFSFYYILLINYVYECMWESKNEKNEWMILLYPADDAIQTTQFFLFIYSLVADAVPVLYGQFLYFYTTLEYYNNIKREVDDDDIINYYLYFYTFVA